MGEEEFAGFAPFLAVGLAGKQKRVAYLSLIRFGQVGSNEGEKLLAVWRDVMVHLLSRGRQPKGYGGRTWIVIDAVRHDLWQFYC